VLSAALVVFGLNPLQPDKPRRLSEPLTVCKEHSLSSHETKESLRRLAKPRPKLLWRPTMEVSPPYKQGISARNISSSASYAILAAWYLYDIAVYGTISCGSTQPRNPLSWMDGYFCLKVGPGCPRLSCHTLPVSTPGRWTCGMSLELVVCLKRKPFWMQQSKS
jgi:hypothetical protein